MKNLSLRIDCAGEDNFHLAVDCNIPATGTTAIYGPSGSGKTTLLQCIAGLRSASGDSRICFSGNIWQDSSTLLAPWQRRIGFVFQDARLFPHLNVKANLEYAVHRRPSTRHTPTSFSKVVDWLQLTDLLQRLPDTLSAGQTQRVAIARALLCAPKLLLMDEPLANLDRAAKDECLYYLKQLHQNLDLPMLYVSHDIEEVSQIADHLIFLEGGRIESQGSLLDLCSRLDTRLSHAEQAAAILVGKIKSHDTLFGLSEVEVAGQVLLVNHLDEPIGQHRRLRIPARDVSICRTRPLDSSILNIIPITVSEIENTSNSRILLRLALGDQYLLARITRKSAQALQLNVGERVYAQIKSAALISEFTPEPAS